MRVDETERDRGHEREQGIVGLGHRYSLNIVYSLRFPSIRSLSLSLSLYLRLGRRRIGVYYYIKHVIRLDFLRIDLQDLQRLLLRHRVVREIHGLQAVLEKLRERVVLRVSTGSTLYRNRRKGKNVNG